MLTIEQTEQLEIKERVEIEIESDDRPRRDKKIRIRVDFYINAQEACLIERLVDGGLFGNCRNAVCHTIVRDKLVSLFSGKR